MTPTTASAASWTWPPEVLAFAAERGITEYLPRILEMTQRIFPSLLRGAHLDEDPEIADDPYLGHYITLDVDSTHLTAEQRDATRRQWTDELYSICPFPLPGLFHLDFVESA
jgi:hypothetical protein